VLRASAAAGTQASDACRFAGEGWRLPPSSSLTTPTILTLPSLPYHPYPQPITMSPGPPTHRPLPPLLTDLIKCPTCRPAIPTPFLSHNCQSIPRRGEQHRASATASGHTQQPRLEGSGGQGANSQRRASSSTGARWLAPLAVAREAQ